MKRILKRAGFALLGILALIGIYFHALILEQVIFYRHYPTDRIDTFADFRAWKPNANAWYRIDVRGSAFLIAEGGIAAYTTKPAIYVFDERGNFVDWTPNRDRWPMPRIIFEPGVEWEPLEETEILWKSGRDAGEQ